MTTNAPAAKAAARAHLEAAQVLIDHVDELGPEHANSYDVRRANARAGAGLKLAEVEATLALADEVALLRESCIGLLEALAESRAPLTAMTRRLDGSYAGVTR